MGIRAETPRGDPAMSDAGKSKRLDEGFDSRPVSGCRDLPILIEVVITKMLVCRVKCCGGEWLRRGSVSCPRAKQPYIRGFPARDFSGYDLVLQ